MGDGIHYTANGAVSGVHEVQGNLFQNNNGYGVNNASANSYEVKYNSWGDISGPTTGDGINGTPDYDPWTHVALFTDWVSGAGSSPVTHKVAVGSHIMYEVKMDAWKVYGADFDLKFDQTLLNVVLVSDDGLFTHQDDCNLSYDNATGVVSFCGYCTSPLDGSAQNLFQVTFQGVAAGVSALDLDETDDAFNMKPPDGASSNIYASALPDGSVTVYPIFTVTGRIDLQGRADDTGAVMTFGTGTNQVYGPFTFSASDYWGSISANNVVEDTYPITVSMDRYLDVISASGKSVAISAAKTALNTVVLLGGDATNDEFIDVLDLTAIGGAFGTIDDDSYWNPNAVINADDVVNILDLVLAGGNFDATSPPWTP